MGIVLSPPSAAPFCATSFSKWWLSWWLGKLTWACPCWTISISPNLHCLWCTFPSGSLAQHRCGIFFYQVRTSNGWNGFLALRVSVIPTPGCSIGMRGLLTFVMLYLPRSVPFFAFRSSLGIQIHLSHWAAMLGRGEEGLQHDFQGDCTAHQRDCIQATHFPCLRQTHTAGTLEN